MIAASVAFELCGCEGVVRETDNVGEVDVSKLTKADIQRIADETQHPFSLIERCVKALCDRGFAWKDVRAKLQESIDEHIVQFEFDVNKSGHVLSEIGGIRYDLLSFWAAGATKQQLHQMIQDAQVKQAGEVVRKAIDKAKKKRVKSAEERMLSAPKASEFPEQQAVPSLTGEQILYVDVANVFDNPFRPKFISFDERKISTLVESIKSNGMMQPLPVRPRAKDLRTFEIAFGHHRLRALQELNIDQVPVIVRGYSDDQMRRAFASEAHQHFGARRESVDMLVLQTIAHLRMSFPVPQSAAYKVAEELLGGWTEKQIQASFKRLAPVLCGVIKPEFFADMPYSQAMRIVSRVRAAMLAYFKLETESGVADEVLVQVREEAWAKGRVVFAELTRLGDVGGEVSVYRADTLAMPETGEIKPNLIRAAALAWKPTGTLDKLDRIVQFDTSLDVGARSELAMQVQDAISRLQGVKAKLTEAFLVGTTAAAEG